MPIQKDKYTDFGNYVMERRKKLNFSLKEISEYCDVSINFISMVERGLKFPSDIVLQKLEEKLKLSNGTLFAMMNKVSPNIINIIFSDKHEGLQDLFSFAMRNKIKDEFLREELMDEVFNVYQNFLKRHNLI